MSKASPFSHTLRSWMDTFMHRSMRGWMQFTKTTGLSMPQFSILMQLHHKGICGMSEISEHFDITSAAASQLAEKLVQSGHIERAEDPNDRRAKLLQLTPRGKTLIETGLSERYRWMEELQTQFTPEDQVKVAEVLNLLINAVNLLEEHK